MIGYDENIYDNDLDQRLAITGLDKIIHEVFSELGIDIPLKNVDIIPSKLNSLASIGISAIGYGVYDSIKHSNLKNPIDFNYQVYLGGYTIIDND